MSESASLPPGVNPERRLGGAARLLLAFIVGALFALVPMYSFYMGREAALRSAGGPADQPLASSAETGRASIEPASTGSGSKPFASRLTYELARPPEERTAAPPRAVPVTVAAATSAPARGQAAAAPPAFAVPPPPATSVVVTPPPAERIANARPISIVPLDPRDRTVEIDREAQRAEYRETPKSQPEPKASKASPAEPKAPTQPSKEQVKQAKAAPAPPTRVFEGRAVELKPLEKAPETASRALPANDAQRDEPEAERVAGVTPIKPAAKAPERTVVAKAPTTAELGPARAEAVAPSAVSSGDVESRFEATRGWLAAAPPTTHTIQLMGTNSEEQLKAHLKSLGKLVEPGKVYVFRTKAQGKPSITVVYGAYADRQSALQALEKLPPSLTVNKPVLRTVNGIRTEMKANNTDG